MYLIDTNICIFAINRRSSTVLEKIKSNIGEGIFVSALTVAELEYGIENSAFPERNRISLLKFLSIFDVLNFDDGDAVAYGRLKADLKKSGKLIGPIDMLLAAQAVSRDFVFVTNNVGEFSRIKGLKIEDWSTS